MSQFMIVWHFAWIASQFLLISRVGWREIRHFKYHRQNIFGHRMQRKDGVLLPAKLSYAAVFIPNVILIGYLFDELLKSTRGMEVPSTTLF